MSKFIRPNKAALNNAQHYAFMDAFITVLVDAGFTAAKIVALLGQLRDAFAEEDRYYMIARASEIIALRDAADKRRDNYYGRVHAIVKAWAGSGIEQMDAAATLLKRVFDLYKVNTSAQIDTESGQLDNLISDLSPSQMQSALQTLGIAPLYQTMVEAHQQVKSLRLDQGVEESEKVTGALRSARQTSDKVYDELTYLIEAFAKTADDAAPYEAFIQRWNGSLKIYQDMIDRKTGSGNKPTPTPTPDGGGGSDDDGGDTPTPTPDPTPDPTPTPDPDPSGGGDDDYDPNA